MRSIALSILVCSLTAASAASAEPAQTASARAQLLFEDGVRLAQQGDCASAEPKLAESFSLEPGIGVSLHLADCEEKNDKLASAWAHFVTAESLARKSPVKDNVSRADLAKQRSAALGPRLARLTIMVEHRVDGMRVALDGVEVRPAEWNMGLPVDRGQHALTVSAPERVPSTQQVDVPADGSALSVSVPELAVVAGPVDRAPSWWTGPRTAGVALAATGGAAVVTGLVLALVAKSSYGDARAQCVAADDCPAGAVHDADSARSLANVATIAIAVGAAVGLAGGALVVFSAPPSRMKVRLGAGGVAIEGRF